MYTKAIAQMLYTTAYHGLERLRNLDRNAGTNITHYVKINVDANDFNIATIMVREDCPKKRFQWLCGFFAAL